MRLLSILPPIFAPPSFPPSPPSLSDDGVVLLIFQRIKAIRPIKRPFPSRFSLHPINENKTTKLMRHYPSSLIFPYAKILQVGLKNVSRPGPLIIPSNLYLPYFFSS